MTEVFSEASLTIIWTAFAVAALLILFAGWRLADTADKLADVTGMGEAMTGAVLLGATTSLPGLLTSTLPPPMVSRNWRSAMP